MKTTENR